ncbi:MAG: enoyl-CoA hydratase/isomerase family protein [Acidobacteriota bacterium]
MSNAVIVEEMESSMVVTFNRPEIRSPLSLEVLKELSRIVERYKARDDLDAVIFTGAGDVFASGADLREIAEVADERSAREFARRGQTLMRQIAAMNVRTVAAIDGVCFGGALDLATTCDQRIASPAALFSHPGVGLGIITGWGGTQRLPKLIGEAAALEMFFTARRVGAAEALRIGLVDDVVDNPLETALERCT